MHLTYTEIKLSQIYNTNKYRFKIPDGAELDDLFFYSVPTSLFAVDDRIPAILRQLLTEAEGCLKSNFLTGASACARKLVYELARRESAEGSDYEERIKSLKAKRPDVDGTYFDNLVAIQRVTSERFMKTRTTDGAESTFGLFSPRCMKYCTRCTRFLK